ncbi:hypothetical protein A0257_03370 [Hymenobacter psoromatis]|nr:hypothetical protein A0257_03370 [Hymenobacter psoromatis]
MLGASFLPAGPAARAQQPDSVFADAPRETLDLVGCPQFRLFDKDFYRNKVFLLGESHGVQRLQDVDFALLRHLNQRADVRHYLAEVDCAKAYYLNDYLHTGNETTLARVFASWVREQAQWGNAGFMAKIRRIRGLNQTLPPARRIQFVGIDGVQDYALLADYLHDLRAAGRPLPPGWPRPSIRCKPPCALPPTWPPTWPCAPGGRWLKLRPPPAAPSVAKPAPKCGTRSLTSATLARCRAASSSCLPTTRPPYPSGTWRTRNSTACGAWATCRSKRA